jgi:hypothetical protein
VAILVVLGVGISKLARPEQPLEERRSPTGSVVLRLGGVASGSAPGSHDVGSVDFRGQITRPVSCGAVSGLQVAASTEQDVATLVDVVENGVCKGLREVVAQPVAGETAEQRVVKAARKGTIIGFAAFEKTGEDSTTLDGSPPRVAVNARYSNRGKSFKGYLAVVVLHELMHAGARSSGSPRRRSTTPARSSSNAARRSPSRRRAGRARRRRRSWGGAARRRSGGCRPPATPVSDRGAVASGSPPVS